MSLEVAGGMTELKNNGLLGSTVSDQFISIPKREQLSIQYL